VRALLLTFLAVPLMSGTVLGQTPNGCPAGSYTVVKTDDSSAVSVLFDGFVVEADSASSSAARCRLHIPLDLPPNTSLGVYKVDYRGFSAMARGSSATLTVVHTLGPNKHKTFRRRIGSRDGEFTFTETLGAGLMKRIGCGSESNLDVVMMLAVRTNDSTAATGMDTMDGQGRVPTISTTGRALARSRSSTSDGGAPPGGSARCYARGRMTSHRYREVSNGSARAAAAPASGR
jgi:hypothetical protein